MPSIEQIQKISLLSDTVLYPEAVSFIQKLVHDESCSPLPTSQVTGLLNVANASSYADLYEFVKHQRDRNWPESKSDIKLFYTELEKILTLMQRKRLKDEFHLVASEANTVGTRQEADELMVLLVHDFIQHLVAENGRLAAEKADERSKEKASRSR